MQKLPPDIPKNSSINRKRIFDGNRYGVMGIEGAEKQFRNVSGTSVSDRIYRYKVTPILTKAGHSLILMLFTMISGVLITACCDDREFYCTRMNSISAFNMDNSGTRASFADEGDSLKAADYMLVVRLADDISVCSNFISIIGSAKATSCEKPQPYPESKAESFFIYSTEDYNSHFPAGSNITKLFEGPDLEKINNIVQKVNGIALKYELTEEPDSVKAHRFIFKLLMENGTELIDTTEAIVLTR